MTRRSLTWLVVPLAALLTAAAHPDGMFLGRDLDAASKPSSAAQKAVLIREGDDEVLLLQTTYQGPAARFAWVVPLPARPSEIFLAEPIFMDQVFLHTNPEQETHVRAEWAPATRRGMGKGAPPAGMGGPGVPGGIGPAPPPPVTVLDRMTVGDFDATVLAATDAAELQSWLTRNGYALPPEAVPVLREYIGKHWVFVALKMLQQAAQARPILTDVPPLGLRFRAERLVYPLTISRVSAPPLSAIMLCVIGEGFFTSHSLPAAPLPTSEASLGDYRRKSARPEGRPALLRECLAQPVLPWDDLSYRRKDWVTGLPANMSRRAGSRFFCLLKPEEMRDLEFVPDPRGQQYHLLCDRKGVATRAAFARLHRRPLALLGRGGEVERLKIAGPPPSGAWGVAALVAILLVWVGLAATWGRRPATRPIALTLLVLLVGTVAFAGYASGSLEDRIDRVLSMVESAAARFRSDTGLYPASVADLAGRRAPTEGLDASGNRLPLRDGWQGPYLSYEPPDPVGGPRLLVDPLNTRLVDCPGFQAVIRVELGSPPPPDAGPGQPAGPKPGAQLWEETPAETVAQLQPLAEALRQDPDGWQVLPRGSDRCLSPMTDGWLVNLKAQRVIVLDGMFETPAARGIVFSVMATQQQPHLSYLVQCDSTGARLMSRPLEGMLGSALRSADTLIAQAYDDPTRPGWGGSRLVRVDPQSGQQTTLAKGRIDAAALGADGQTLYVLCDGELQAMSLDGSNRRVLRRGLDHGALAVCSEGLLFGERGYARRWSHKQRLGLVGPDGSWTQLAARPEAMDPGILEDGVLTYITTADREPSGPTRWIHTIRRRDVRTGREKVLLRLNAPPSARACLLCADAQAVLLGLTHIASGSRMVTLLTLSPDGSLLTRTARVLLSHDRPEVYQMPPPKRVPNQGEVSLESL